MQVSNPATLGGTPQTMSTNNWWDGVSAAVSDGVDIANRAVAGYVQLREAKSVIASRGVPEQNRPPGSFGLNPQAAGIAGGMAEGVAGAAMSPAVLGLVALGLVLLLLVVKR